MSTKLDLNKDGGIKFGDSWWGDSSVPQPGSVVIPGEYPAGRPSNIPNDVKISGIAKSSNYPIFAASDSRYATSVVPEQIYGALGIQSYVLNHPPQNAVVKQNYKQHAEAAYIEARRYEGASFTACIESDICNYGNEYHISPVPNPFLGNEFNDASVNLWLGSGCGDTIARGNTTKSASAAIVILSNSGANYNPNPKFLRGIVIADKSIDPSTNEAISMMENHQIAWYWGNADWSPDKGAGKKSGYVTGKKVDGSYRFSMEIHANNASGDDAYVSLNGFLNNSFAPSSNAITLGTTTKRWAQGFGVKGWQSQSDERAKHSISDINESVMNAWEKVQFQQFKYNSDGDGAKWVIGVIAQRIIEAFASEGINALDYDLVHYEDDSYSVCYEQALALECACLRRRLRQLQP